MMNHSLYFGSTSYYIDSSGSAALSSVGAASATFTNAKVTGDLYVDGVLTSNEYVKNIVKAVGGQIYIAPTFVATPSQTTIQCTAADSTYLSLTISDNTAITALAYAGANWYKDSKIMFSGTLQGNQSGAPEIVFASNIGEVTANMNSSSGKLQIKVAYSGASTYFKTGSLTYSDIAVMMYQIKVPSGTNAGLHPIGVHIKAYGNDNKNSYIDIFGGTSDVPNARLGLLNGLANMSNGTQPTGWGIYTDNGYFNGTIISSSGTIGDFNIGHELSSGTWGDANGSVFISVGYNPGANNKSIGGSANNITNWVFTAADKFGVTKTGEVYATSGKIAGWKIADTYLASGSATAPGSNILYLSPSGTATSYNIANQSKTGWMITAGTTFGVNKDGGVYTTSGKIGPWELSATYIRNGSITSATNTSVAGVYLGSDGLNISNGTAATTSYITKTAVNIGNKLTWNSSNNTLSVSGNIDAKSLTIGDNVTIPQDKVYHLTEDLGGKASSDDLATVSNKVTAVYGTCNTNAGTQVKQVTCSNFELFNGALITIVFSVNNTYCDPNNNAPLQLKVGSEAAKSIWVAGALNSNSNQLLWGQGAIITFRYDGLYFIVVGEPRNWYGKSTTGDSTVQKVDTPVVTGCVICKGTMVSLSMEKNNTASSPTLNIASTGAKPIYSGYSDTGPTTANGLGWTSGSTVNFVFDGANWRVDSFSSASTTATNYLYFDSTNGLVVSQTGAVSTGYNTQIKPGEINIRNGSTILASYGSTITIGKTGTNDRNVYIDSNGVNIRKSSTVLATYGDTITLGQIADGQTRVQIDNDSLDIISRTGSTDTPVATFGEVSRIGIGSSIAFNNSSLSFSNENGDEIMNITGDGIAIGKSGNPTFSVGSQSIALIGANKDDVFRVSSGGGGTYVEKDHRRYEANFSNSQVSSGVTVDAAQNIKQIASAPTNVKVNLFGYYTNTYTVDGQSVTTSEFRLVKTMSLSSSYYTSSYSNNANSVFGKIVLSSGSNGGVKRVQNWVSQYCTSGHILFTIQFEYNCRIPEYSQLNMNGNIVVAGTNGGNIACTDIDAGYINADVIDASDSVYTDTLNAPLFIYRDFSTSSLTVGANAAFAISFSQLNNYSVPTGYVPFAFSRISVDNNYLYFRWMNPDSIFNGSVAVGRNSSSSQQTFVLSVRIIFAQGGLFGT